MTDEQIQDCMGEIYAAVNEARQGNKTKLLLLAITMADHREASAIADAKGYHYHEMDRSLTDLVQLLPDKVVPDAPSIPKPPKPEPEPEGRCMDCVHWAALVGAKLPAYLVELDIGIGVCMESKAMKLKTSHMHCDCDGFEARK